MRPNYQNSGLIDGTQLTRHSFIAVISAIAVLFIGTITLQAQDDISDLIQRARGNFKPVSEKEPAEARAQLRERMKEVADYVNPSSKNGKVWLRYLRWEALNQ